MSMVDYFSGDNLFYLILTAIYALLIGYLVLHWYRSRGKYLIRIKSPEEKTLLIKPQSDGKTIVVEKAKGRKLGWKFTFDMSCMYFSSFMFGLRKRLTLDVMPDANKAISYNQQTKEADIPKWDRKTHEEYATLGVLRFLQQLMEAKTSILMYIVIALIILDIVLPFIISGRFNI